MKPLVYIVDDETTVREGLKTLLEVAGYDVDVFGDWIAFRDALARRGDRAAVLLLDVRLGRENGLELYQRLRVSEAEAPPVIFMTAYADLPMAVQALRLEAVDFLEKPLRRADLFAALERVAGHGVSSIDTNAYNEAAQCFAELSPREAQVFRGMVQGQSSKMIARHLGISPRTVEVHRSRVLQKMRADNLADLVRKAVLLDPHR